MDARRDMQLHFSAARGEGGAHRLSRQPRLEACRAPLAEPRHQARLDAARQRFRDLPRRPVHPELRVEDRTVDGPTGYSGAARQLEDREHSQRGRL